MYAKILFAATALFAAVSAQTNHSVMVGLNGALTFDPPVTNASVGDNIVFTFLTRNHSVWQSTFANPCTLKDQGFTTNFHPINVTDVQAPSVIIQVTDTTPFWFYCPQTNPANHCQMGMVGAVNPTPNATFDEFQAAAKALAGPGNATTATTGSSSSVPSASGVSSASATLSSTTGSSSADASPSATPAPGKNGAASLEVGKLLAGVAVIVALAL